MKLSEMIKVLETYKEKVGDVDVTADVTFNLAEIEEMSDPLRDKINRLRRSEHDRNALKEKHPKPRLSAKQQAIRDRLKPKTQEGDLSE